MEAQLTRALTQTTSGQSTTDCPLFVLKGPMPTKPKAQAKPKAKKEVKPQVAAAEAPAPVGPTELENAKARQAHLLDLRKRMTDEGIDSVGKLDVLLSQVNQRVAELGG